MFVYTCPVCGSAQTVLSLDGDRAVICSECDATWEQHGGRQTHVRPGKLRGVARRERRGLVVFPMEE